MRMYIELNPLPKQGLGHSSCNCSSLVISSSFGCTVESVTFCGSIDYFYIFGQDFEIGFEIDYEIGYGIDGVLLFIRSERRRKKQTKENPVKLYHKRQRQREEKKSLCRVSSSIFPGLILMSKQAGKRENKKNRLNNLLRPTQACYFLI